MNQPVERLALRPTALLLFAVAAYLYSNLFLLPHIPILQSDDQVYFWMYAQRLLHGEHAYLDFFQLTPPGTDIFFLALFKAFGERLWVLNSAVIFLGVALCCVCLWVGQQIMNVRFAVLAAVTYLVFIFSRPLNATHHWFSVLFGMCGVAVIMPARNPRRIAFAAALVGLATFFTHTHGIAMLAAVALFLVWEGRRDRQSSRQLLSNLAILCGSFLLVVMAFNAYFVFTAGFERIWYEQVTYIGKYKVEGWFTPNFGLPAALQWRNFLTFAPSVFVYILLPVIYPLSFLAARRSSPAPGQDRRIILLSLAGASLFAEVAVSPNWLRIYSVSLPGILLALWAVSRIDGVRRLAAPVIGAAMLVFASLQIWSRHHHPLVVTQLPAGVAAVPAPLFEQISWVAGHTRPGNFLFQAGWPGLYLPLALRDPLYIDTVGTNEQTPPEEVERAIHQLDEKRVGYVLWSPRLNASDPENPSGDHLGPLRQYLRDRYTLEKVFVGADELWERKPSQAASSPK